MTELRLLGDGGGGPVRKGLLLAAGWRAHEGEADDSAHGRLPDGACIPVHWRVYLSCKPNIQLASWARLEWSANASFSFLRTIRGLRWRGWPPVTGQVAKSMAKPPSGGWTRRCPSALRR